MNIEPRFYTVQHGISTNAHYNAKTLLKKTTGDNFGQLMNTEKAYLQYAERS